LLLNCKPVPAIILVPLPLDKEVKIPLSFIYKALLVVSHPSSYGNNELGLLIISGAPAPCLIYILLAIKLTSIYIQSAKRIILVHFAPYN